MTSLTRAAVHKSLGQPCFEAPCRKRASKACSWSSARAEARRTGVACRPPGTWAWRSQRCRETRWTPKARATVEGDWPSRTAATARLRRNSRSAAVPGVLMIYSTQRARRRVALLRLDSVSPDTLRGIWEAVPAGYGNGNGNGEGGGDG